MLFSVAVPALTGASAFLASKCQPRFWIFWVDEGDDNAKTNTEQDYRRYFRKYIFGQNCYFDLLRYVFGRGVLFSLSSVWLLLTII